MKLTLRVLVLFGLVTGTLSQGFDLSDALDDVAPTPAKPKDPPKKNDDFTLDLADAFDDSDPKPPTARPPAPVPPKTGGGGGGGSFGDSDLLDVSGGDYKPDGGKSGGRAADPGYDPQGGVDQPQGEAGSGQIAGIVSAVGMALLGAASSYFAYQKKKLCFKMQGGADPESGKSHGTHSEPQVLSNLLNTS
ncbi:CD99 molecule isoform X1 [Sphaeramia orbicularis]|uniref:CD99 antigen-like n=1 Tax=Sphaeramia orbicularis TaxID=375764 RepID=A0A673AWT5_9TELE|nr:CD99 antigen-like isoform X1 [Sphaeramia orbicularis]